MPAGSAENGMPGAPRISLLVAPAADGVHRADVATAAPLIADARVECVPVQARFTQKAAEGERRVVPLSPAAAMNLASQAARGDILAFLAPDLVPGNGWAEAVEAFFDAHPEAEVAAGRTLVQPEGAFGLAEAVLESSAVAAVPEGGGRGPAGEGAASLHCAVRRGAFDRTGGLDEGLPPEVTAFRPLGGLLAARAPGPPVAAGMIAWRAASGGLGAFFSRQFRSGLAGYYAPQGQPLGARVRRALLLPVRAVRLARGVWPLAALPPLLVGGVWARLLGMLWGLARGGRRRGPLASPLVGPESQFLVPDEDEATRPAVSVVVPVHWEPEWVRVCLASLVRQDVGEPYEVVLVCDSRGDFPEWITAAFPRVRVCYCDPGDGPGGARNRGIAATRGDYVASTDDDCLAEKGWLGAIVGACRRSGRPVTGWTEIGDVSSPLARGLNYAEQGMARPRRPCYVEGGGGGNLCVPRALLERSGARFAEGVYGAEDVALLRRMPREALPVLMEPAAGVRHLHWASLGGHLRRTYRLAVGSGRLRRAGGMRGSLFARCVWLAPLLLPLRLALTILRTIRCSGTAVFDVLRLYPVLICAYAVYAAGFAAGATAAASGGCEEPASQVSGQAGGRRR